MTGAPIAPVFEPSGRSLDVGLMVPNPSVSPSYKNEIGTLNMLRSKNSKATALLHGTALTTLVLLATPFAAQAQEAEDEVVAVGTFIPNEKRITSEITSVLDEEIFETTGAGDIAGALTRVTGLSLSQGKFVIVRGLNERYSSATLNGSPLPSPEPLRRVAPLDLFPTSILSDVVVQKTFTPEYSGEFGGGAINMKTKALPDDKFFTVSVSGSYNTQTSFQDGLVYDGSDTDWLGFDDGLRDLPPLDANGLPTQNFENFSTLIVDNSNSIPGDISGRISAGNRYDLDSGKSIGILGTIGYSNEWETREGITNTANIGAGNILQIQDGGSRFSTENKVSLNGMLTAGVEWDENNEFQAVGFFSRQSSKEARIYDGTGDLQNNLIRQDSTEWIERDVLMGQLLGTHYFPSLEDAELSWRLSYAEASRNAPYERLVTYEDYQDGNGFRYQFNRQGSNSRLSFSELDDQTIDAGVDFVLPMFIQDRSVEFKLGGSYLDKSRDSEQADFRYFGTIPPELRLSRIDQIYSDAVVDAGILEIRRTNSTSFPDASSAGLEVAAVYTGVDVELSENLRVAAGLRYEDSEQTTAISQLTVPGSEFNFDPLAQDWVLPSATLTYTFADSWQLRLAASKTINRPQFRELTPVLFVNTDTEDRFVGNPFLKNSESLNLDARLEYYFASNQFVTLGVFYKDLTNPIEEFVLPLGNEFATSFVNAPSAELIGLEAEFEKKFDLSTMDNAPEFWSGKDLVLRTNYTYVDSDVSADGTVQITPPSVNPSQGVTPITLSAAGLYTDGRKLQGQSDHLANIQLGIDDFENNWEATLLVNYSSERIRAVEFLSNRLPAIKEQLPLSVDLVFNFDLPVAGDDYRIGLKATNIFDDGYEAFQELGDSRVTIDGYDIGTTFSMSIKREF